MTFWVTNFNRQLIIVAVIKTNQQQQQYLQQMGGAVTNYKLQQQHKHEIK